MTTEPDAAPALDHDRYRLVSLLGEGGMAMVYRAWDERLQVWRAIKLLKPKAAAVPSIRSRFLDEARAMARLHHPNILTVHDVGTDEERPFMVMELIDGGSLMDVVEEGGPLPPHSAAAIMALVLEALQFAHDNHVVHRDIKPHNLMLTTKGVPLVADFGIARIGGDRDSNRTGTGAMMGTLAYMAPEQRTSARGVDGRADIYAAGNTLYAMVTGEEPFDLYAAPPHDPQLTRLPPALRAVIARATRHSPGDRFATATEMAAVLRALPEDLAVDHSGHPEPSQTFQLVPNSQDTMEPITHPPAPPPVEPAVEPPESTDTGPPIAKSLQPPALRRPRPNPSNAWGFGLILMFGFVMFAVIALGITGTFFTSIHAYQTQMNKAYGAPLDSAEPRPQDFLSPQEAVELVYYERYDEAITCLETSPTRIVRVYFGPLGELTQVESKNACLMMLFHEIPYPVRGEGMGEIEVDPGRL